MAETATRRASPRALWPEARSVVVLASSYAPAGDPLGATRHPDRAAISVYARNRDYHDGVKRRLKALGHWMAGQWDGRLKVFVDTAPVMEKPLAEQAGLGWQGRHGNLVSRRLGNWFVLSELFTTLELPADPPGRDHCGNCHACRPACPTGAFDSDGRLDPRRCISYLTIEHKGTIPAGLRPALGNRVYGCDECLAACPWNKFARPTADRDFWPRAELSLPRLGDLAGLDDAAFRQVFAGSPIKRVGRDRFMRNVLIAIGNSGDPGLLAAVLDRLEDDAATVRAMAAWALGRLADPATVDSWRRRRLAVEDDPAVRAEWNGV